jgi:hypothetical protein
MEHVKSARGLQSVRVNAKRSVLIEEMEHVLKFGWVIKAEAIVSAKLRASSAT